MIPPDISSNKPRSLRLHAPTIDKRDHIQGAAESSVILLEYGDYECPFSAQAHSVVEKLLQDLHGEMGYVFRNFPLVDIHFHARQAALAAEAAAQQGKFWEMHHMLFENQGALDQEDLLDYAYQLGLNVKRFEKALNSKNLSERLAEDINSAIQSGVTETPTFFINGERFKGQWRLDSLRKESELEKVIRAKHDKREIA